MLTDVGVFPICTTIVFTVPCSHYQMLSSRARHFRLKQKHQLCYS